MPLVPEQAHHVDHPTYSTRTASLEGQRATCGQREGGVGSSNAVLSACLGAVDLHGSANPATSGDEGALQQGSISGAAAGVAHLITVPSLLTRLERLPYRMPIETPLESLQQVLAAASACETKPRRRRWEGRLSSRAALEAVERFRPARFHFVHTRNCLCEGTRKDPECFLFCCRLHVIRSSVQSGSALRTACARCCTCASRECLAGDAPSSAAHHFLCAPYAPPCTSHRKALHVQKPSTYPPPHAPSFSAASSM